MARKKKHPTVRDCGNIAIDLHFALCDKLERSRPVNNQKSPFEFEVEALSDRAQSLMCDLIKLADKVDLFLMERGLSTTGKAA